MPGRDEDDERGDRQRIRHDTKQAARQAKVTVEDNTHTAKRGWRR